MSKQDWVRLVEALRALLPQVMDGVQHLYSHSFGTRVYVGTELIGRGAYLQIFGGHHLMLQAQLAYMSDGRLIGIAPDSDEPVSLDESIDLLGAARWVIDQLCVGMEDGVVEEWMAMLNLEPVKT